MGEWLLREFDDGTLQWSHDGSSPYAAVFIEKVVGPKSRRKQWHIVDRRPRNRGANIKYPPTISPPFKDIKTAKVAFLVMLAAGLLDPIAG
jgi:hypothetical protein